MSKFTIVFHSVCGNTYDLAQYFCECLQEKGQEVSLYRVKDESLQKMADQFGTASGYIHAIMDRVVIEKGEDVLGSDMLLLGSPTYYGCVSAQMKAFMDSFESLWAEAKTSGMYFGCFSSVGDSGGGSELCMQVMNTFAQHMAMIPISVPCNIGGSPQPAYGIKLVTGAASDNRLDEGTRTAVRGYVDHILRVIGA